MLRHLLASGAVALALVLAAAPAVPAQVGKGATGNTTSVLYRSKGQANWQLFGTYRTEQSGKSVFQHLSAHGYEVKLEVTNRPVPPTPARKPSGLLPAHETVSHQKAREVFDWMARQHDVAFRYPVDGCYARAQLMVERMRKNHFVPYKVWAFANGDTLYARTRNNPSGHVTWSYHVAPILRVRMGSNTQRWYVIDPSLFSGPATIAQWEAAMKKDAKSHRPYLTVTRVGAAPTLLSGKKAAGTGYWPAADPREGAHAHAVATMKRYKPLEGKQPSKGTVFAAPAERRLRAGRVVLGEGLFERRRVAA